MEGTVPARRPFPYANWGPWTAVLGILLAIGAGIMLSAPVALVDGAASGEDLSDTASALSQLAFALGLLLVPFAIAASRGATQRDATARLGLRGFQPPALLSMLAAAAAYLAFGIAYALIVGEPKQEDIADKLGAVPMQILLIVVAAPISEEVCFRGFLFGGLRERLPRLAAALISATIFGALHVATGVSAVPPLIFFGFVLALLYERTGSIVPGILLHMLNNSVALIGQ